MSATSRDIFGCRSLERGHLSSSGQGRGCCQASKVRDGPHLAAQPQGMAERLPEAGFSHQPRFPGEKTNTVKGRDLFKDTQLIDRPPGCAGAPDKAASQSPQGKATVRCAWNVSLSAFVTPLLPLGQRPPTPGAGALRAEAGCPDPKQKIWKSVRSSRREHPTCRMHARGARAKLKEGSLPKPHILGSSKEQHLHFHISQHL